MKLLTPLTINSLYFPWSPVFQNWTHRPQILLRLRDSKEVVEISELLLFLADSLLILRIYVLLENFFFVWLFQRLTWVTLHCFWNIFLGSHLSLHYPICRLYRFICIMAWQWLKIIMIGWNYVRMIGCLLRLIQNYISVSSIRLTLEWFLAFARCNKSGLFSMSLNRIIHLIQSLII